MDVFQTVFLALVQGITEFLPVSSSAHLVLVAPVMGWQDQGLAFDIAVHLGTLLAVLAYFRRDLLTLTVGLVSGGAARLEVGYLAVATVPAVVAGFVLGDWLETWSRSVGVIATTTLVFGLLLGYADRRVQRGVQMTLWIAVAIGLAQVLALVPGTSRSGITITAALLLGLSRTDAARFSFLMAIPVIAGAALLMTLDALQDPTFDFGPLLLGGAVAGLSAFACIGAFMTLVERIGMMPFVVYRVLLSLALVAFVL